MLIGQSRSGSAAGDKPETGSVSSITLSFALIGIPVILWVMVSSEILSPSCLLSCEKNSTFAGLLGVKDCLCNQGAWDKTSASL